VATGLTGRAGFRHRRFFIAVICAVGAALVSGFAIAATLPASGLPSAGSIEEHPERQLIHAVDAMQAGNYYTAQKSLEALLEREPNFHLAQLLYGQLLALRSGTHAGSPLADDSDDPRLRDLVDEFRARIDDSRSSPPADSLPSPILKLDAATRYAVVVDLSKTRMYVLENDKGNLHVIRDYYSAIARNGYGKQSAGDLRTPVGVYHATGFTPGSALPPFYGAGAFPLNYPNSWDRAHGKSGNGIWVHGVPANTYARAPRSSEGCVTLANEDLLSLKPLIEPGETPVVFSDRVEWLPAAKVAAQRDTLLKAIEAWRRDWSALDTRSYLDFYASDFKTDDGMDKAAFADYKRRVNAGKKHVDVRLGDLSLFGYPGESGLVLAQFTQDYKSDNFDATSRKDQYWRRQADGAWKIVREENR
jgi:murein L,D-transpeptidase YafK